MKKETNNKRKINSKVTVLRSNMESRILIDKIEDRLNWFFEELNELINNQALLN